MSQARMRDAGLRVVSSLSESRSVRAASLQIIPLPRAPIGSASRCQSRRPPVSDERSHVNRLPFAMPGRFWRGNLHTHSTRSDGHLDPAATVGWYRDNGYDFVALTDHFVARYGYRITDTTSMREAGFTTIIGAELHAPRTEVGNLWHIVT